MTVDFPEPLVLRAHVFVGEKIATAQVAMSDLVNAWLDVPITSRRYTVRKAKMMLAENYALCSSCAGTHSFDPAPDMCPSALQPCNPVHLVLWDGRAEWPVTEDTLKAYPPAARFRLTAVEPSQPTLYASLELAGPEWLEAGGEQRHRHMRAVVDKLLTYSPGADVGTVRTFIWDGYGQREIPYRANWARSTADEYRWR